MSSEIVGSGVAVTYPMQCSALRKNDYVMLKRRPCKIIEVKTSEKKVHNIINFTGQDIFTDKEFEGFYQSMDNIDVPVVKIKEYQLLSINDNGFVSLMDLETCDTKNDLQLPDGEIGDDIKLALEKDENGILVTVVSACREQAIRGWKTKWSYVDIGANLTHETLATDVDEIIKKARAAGLTRIMVKGESTDGVSKLVDKYPEILRYTAGVHPHKAEEYKEKGSTNFIVPYLSQPKCVAIGECGLDFTVEKPEPAVQERVFEIQLMIACAFNKPLFLHENGASKRMVELLQKYHEHLPLTVIHRFKGTVDEAKKYIEMGLYIGITGYLTKPDADGLRKALREGIIPLDRLMLETGAPDEYPEILSREQYTKTALVHHSLATNDINQPCSLPVICETVALLMGQDYREVAKQTTDTAFLVYGLD